MKFPNLHPWDVTPTEAARIQSELRSQVVVRPLERPPEFVAGCDISFDRFSDDVHAGVVVLRLPDFAVVDRAGVIARAHFPYVPGLLSFRETPALLEALERLRIAPDVLFLDGQGLAHPRRFGIACHVGLIAGLPALGCAKSILVGRHDEPPERAGGWAPLVARSETVGAAVRTKDRVVPVIVSIGHLIDLAGAIDLTLRCTRGYYSEGGAGDTFGSAPVGRSRYRIPEPTRQAHRLVNALRRGESIERVLSGDA